MKSFKIACLLVLVLPVALSSCSEESLSTLIVGAWDLTDIQENGFSAISDFEAQACLRDDLHVFRENGEFMFDNGPLKCDPSVPQTVVVSNYTVNESDMTIIFDGVTFSDLIIEKNSMSFIETDGGINYTYLFRRN